MNDHPFVVLPDPSSGLDVEVDVDMAPLIRALWERDIGTFGCCEGDASEYAYLQFLSLEDMHRFLTALIHTPEPWRDSITPFHVTRRQHRRCVPLRRPSEKRARRRMGVAAAGRVPGSTLTM